MRLIDADAAIDTLNEQIKQCNKALGSFDISLKDEYAVKVERASLEAYKEQLENMPSIQPDTTTHDSIPAETGGNDEDRTSGECISRQVVAKFLDDWLFCLDENCHKQSASDLKMIIKDFKNLPSVQPERKTGRWIPDNTDYYRTKFICSVCGESEEVPTTGFGYGTMWGYCPNCGAKMEGGEQE